MSSSPSLKKPGPGLPGPRGSASGAWTTFNYLGPGRCRDAGTSSATCSAGRVTEQIQLDDGTISAQWLHFTNKGYDPGVHARTGPARAGGCTTSHFAPDTREDIIPGPPTSAWTTGVFIETGPHKHAIQQTFFLYVYEPGGNRIELCNPVARLVLAPELGARSPGPRPNGPEARALGPERRSSPSTTHGTPPVD